MDMLEHNMVAAGHPIVSVMHDNNLIALSDMTLHRLGTLDAT